MSDLSAKQLRFVAEYRVDYNGKQAAIRASYSSKTAEAQASRLLRHVKVAAELAKQERRLFDRLDLTAQNTLEELRRVLHFDPGQIYDQSGCMKPIHELPPEVRSCIASVEVREIIGESGSCVGRMTKLKFWNKIAAISKAMDHFNLAGGLPGVSSLPPPAEQVAKAAETTAQLEKLLKEKAGYWHRRNVVPINTPPQKAE